MALSLAEFLSQLPSSTARDEFAKSCRTSLAYLRHIAAGRKAPSVEMCVAIERASAGLMRCETLRPDVDWDYLASRRVADRQSLEPSPPQADPRRSMSRQPAANHRR
jgi:DNA-binding transcriptional regulator YdaS (Cro superfamily)